MERQWLSFGPFRLNCANGILLREGEPVALGQRGARLLGAFLRQPGEVLTKAELMDAAWPDATVEEANLSVQIAQLRKALGARPAGGDWIVTVPRIGYRFVPDASLVEADGNMGFWPGTGSAGRIGTRRYVAATLAALAAAIIAVLAAWQPAQPLEPAASWPDAAIAVLPFDDMSGDGELSYFGAGVSEDITAMLTRVPNLSVVARNSAFQHRGQARDVRRIGEELGATHVLEGSIRRDDDRLRIVAQLIDARTGRHIWAERFDRTGTDPRALQDEVTHKIVSALAGSAGTLALQQYAEAWGKDSANLQEYDYVMRSLSQIANGTPEATEVAEAVLAEGLARFPDSSLLKAQAASTVMWRFARGWSDSEEPLEEIRRAGKLAREALSDPMASPMLRLGAYISLAYAHMVERRFDQAIAEAEAAVALAPYVGRIVYYLAEIPIVAGRPELTLQWIEQAEKLYPANDPRQQELASMKAVALLHRDGPAAALEVLETIRSSDAIVLRTTFLMKAFIYVLLDRMEDARAEVARLREHDPSWTLARHRQRFFYVDPAQLGAILPALAAAGLPEE